MAITEQARDGAYSRKGLVLEFPIALAAGTSDYFTPDLQKYDFSGYASMQIVMTGTTNATLTVQLETDNSNTDANFLVPFDTYGTVHPALCTALAFTSTPKKMFENIAIPAACRVRWKFTEAGGAAAVAGTAYLYLQRGS